MKLILIADDYFELAETLGEAIATALAVEILTARDGEAAVDLALLFRPNIAVLDIEMPVLDGIETARRIRAAMGEQCPLLIAHSGGVNASRASHSGMFDFVLSKPTDFNRLLRLIEVS